MTIKIQKINETWVWSVFSSSSSDFVLVKCVMIYGCVITDSLQAMLWYIIGILEKVSGNCEFKKKKKTCSLTVVTHFKRNCHL